MLWGETEQAYTAVGRYLCIPEIPDFSGGWVSGYPEDFLSPFSLISGLYLNIGYCLRFTLVWIILPVYVTLSS